MPFDKRHVESKAKEEERLRKRRERNKVAATRFFLQDMASKLKSLTLTSGGGNEPTSLKLSCQEVFVIRLYQ